MLAYACVSDKTKPSRKHAASACAQEADILAQNDSQIISRHLEGNRKSMADIAKEGEYERQKNLERERQCSDLQAQWAMADVTWYAFMAGMLGILLVFAIKLAEPFAAIEII